jgi:hypothetical protein
MIGTVIAAPKPILPRSQDPMGTKTKAATDAVKNLYQARQRAIADLEAILNDRMPPLEAVYTAKTEAFETVYEKLEKEVGPVRAMLDPRIDKVQAEQGAAWAALDDVWMEVKAWVEQHRASYNGMDTALKTLKERISKKKALDFFKTQKSLPEAKVTYETGIKANQKFQEMMVGAAEAYRNWKT